jgi:hypothetical protein
MCHSTVSDNTMDIIWAAWNTINIDIECEKCKKHTMIKAEIAHVDVSNLQIWSDTLSQLKNQFQSIRSRFPSEISQEHTKTEAIMDNQIVELSRDLKGKNMSVSDLFKEDSK